MVVRYYTDLREQNTIVGRRRRRWDRAQRIERWSYMVTANELRVAFCNLPGDVYDEHSKLWTLSGEGCLANHLDSYSHIAIIYCRVDSAVLEWLVGLRRACHLK